MTDRSGLIVCVDAPVGSASVVPELGPDVDNNVIVLLTSDAVAPSLGVLV